MYVKLRVFANAKKEKLEKASEDHFNVWVREKAERNMANKRVLEIVREYFGTGKARIISGHHSPSKIIAVE